MQNILNAELTEIKHLLLMNSKNVLTSTEVSNDVRNQSGLPVSLDQ